MNNLHLIRITRTTHKGNQAFKSYSFLGDNQDGSGKFFTSFEQAQERAKSWLEMERILVENDRKLKLVRWSNLVGGMWMEDDVVHSIEFDLIEIGNIILLS